MRVFVSKMGDRVSDFTGPHTDIREYNLEPRAVKWNYITATVDCAGFTPEGTPVESFTHLFIVPDNVSVYGPYIIESLPVKEEARFTTFNCRKDLALDFIVFDADNDAFFEDTDQQIIDILKIKPYIDYINGDRSTHTEGRDFYEQIRGEVIRSTSLSQVNGALEEWGMKAMPYITAGLKYSLRVIPLYPIETRPFTVDERFPGLMTTGLNETDKELSNIITRVPQAADPKELEYWAALPSLTPDSLYNLPGNYITRRVKTTLRLWSDVAEDQILYNQGNPMDPRPIIYIDAKREVLYATIAADLERWKLQNTSINFEGTRTVPPGEDGYLALRQRFSYQAKTYMINEINHTWSDTEAYKQRISATLWQGFGPFYGQIIVDEPTPPEPPEEQVPPPVTPFTDTNPQPLGNLEAALIYKNAEDSNERRQYFTLDSANRVLTFYNSTIMEIAVDRILAGDRVKVIDNFGSPMLPDWTFVVAGKVSVVAWRYTGSSPPAFVHDNRYTFIYPATSTPPPVPTATGIEYWDEVSRPKPANAHFRIPLGRQIFMENIPASEVAKIDALFIRDEITISGTPGVDYTVLSKTTGSSSATITVSPTVDTSLLTDGQTYQFGYIRSGIPVPGPSSTTLSSPGLNVIEITSSSIRATVSSVSNADTYVMRLTSPSQGLIETRNVTPGTEETFSGLTANASYILWAIARDSTGTYSESRWVSRNFTAAASGSLKRPSISVTSDTQFIAVTREITISVSNIDSRATGIRLSAFIPGTTRSRYATTLSTSSATATHTFQGLEPSTNYAITADAVDSTGTYTTSSRTRISYRTGGALPGPQINFTQEAGPTIRVRLSRVANANAFDVSYRRTTSGSFIPLPRITQSGSSTTFILPFTPSRGDVVSVRVVSVDTTGKFTSSAPLTGSYIVS